MLDKLQLLRFQMLQSHYDKKKEELDVEDGSTSVAETVLVEYQLEIHQSHLAHHLH